MLEGSTMRLNHLDLHVTDVAATAEFLTRYLGLTLIDTRANGGLAILSDGHGLELVLSQAIEKFGSTDQSATGLVSYHIGFIVPDRTEVDAIYAAMREGNVPLHEPREMRGGWLFYCHAPGHVLVEIGARQLLC
jgi:catechol 2,3-dioxygenase-like lactoylglutathione lyase family enzyme